MTGDLPPTRKTRRGTKRPGGFRALLDAALCLYVAVILFRTFEVEGYIISTGSMAPALLGFHKRVVCPSCGYSFAFGIAVDESGAAADTTGHAPRPGLSGELARTGGQLPGDVRCPNCGQDAINTSEIPPSHGDQLLVQKEVYEFRRPRRWEVAVLRSPARPTPPFVKRIVGLPNESVQILFGDIYVDGKICRKDLPQQRAMRILVFDNEYLPRDAPNGRGCWIVEPAPATWQAHGNGFAFDGALANSRSENSQTEDSRSGDADAKTSWLAFRRWIRRGGTHQTETPVEAPAAEVHVSPVLVPQVRFDEPEGRLIATGALSENQRNRLRSMNPNLRVREAIDRLCRQSHEGPITDDYGYNRADVGNAPSNVPDVMLQCDATVRSGAGELMFEIADGRQTFRLTFNRGQNEAQLTVAGRASPLRSRLLPPGTFARPMNVELSVFDCQVIAALNGTPLFPAWEAEVRRAVPAGTPVRIGAREISAEILNLKVYRDVYYTRGQGRHAVDRPIQLGPDEFFALGDNSPASNDGRNWLDGAVKESQLIGKPLVVHLPSRPGKITIGGRTRYFRIPDFSRMRYIH